MKRQIPFILLFSAFLLAMVSTTAGEIITVDDDGPADFNNIQAAIADTNDGDTVSVADGTYTGDGNRDIQLTGKSITVRSKNGPENCIIDCQATENEQHRAFYFHNAESSSSTLQGFTIKNGLVRGDYGKGGGIYCDKSSPLISNCIITDNMASKGAAIYCRDSNSIIESCKITKNWAWSGGGIYCSQSSPVITNCLISENLAEYGGGIRWSDSSPVISNCNITKNTASLYGSGEGAGIFCSGSAPAKIINCTITANKTERLPHSGNGGGGIWCSSPLDIINCTICDNIDPDYGGIFCYDSNMAVVNCIITNNSARQIGHDLDTASGCSVAYSNIQRGWPGQSNIDTDPCFAFAGDYHLVSNSPCIDTGDPNYTPGPDETDLDGNPRIIGGRIDMGTYEYNSNSPSIAVSARSFTFRSDWPQPAPQKLLIRNCGGGTLKWKIIEDCDWLQAVPAKGASTGRGNEVTLTVDPNALALGSYNCTLTVTGSNAVNSPVTIHVRFNVGQILRVPHQFGTIQQAIDAAEDYDVVLVADGNYTGDGNRDLQLTGKSITVRSENGPEDTIIDCEGTLAQPHRGLNFKNNENTNAIFNGFTITNGYVLDIGAGINCSKNIASALTISNCNITGNTALEGNHGSAGGLYIADGIYFINNCRINKNYAAQAGGICFDDWTIRRAPQHGSLTSLTINNCTITENTSTKGSGGGIIDCSSSYLTINNSTISSNSAVRNGGGICLEESHGSGYMIINNCTISDNTAMGRGGSGGGISVTDSIYLIHNSAITGNTSEKNGGGIYSGYHGYGSSILTDCQISGNSSLAQGGGICFEGYDYSSKLTNCTISNNSSAAEGAGIHFFPYQSDGLTLNDCQISGNSAHWGGGIHCIDNSAKITNCNISANIADSRGGISCSGTTEITNCKITGNQASYGLGGGIGSNGTITITNCTIAANRALGDRWYFGGGGIACDGYNDLAITNSVLWGNEAIRGQQIYLTPWGGTESDVQVIYSDIQNGWPGEGNIDLLPSFVDPGFWDPNGTPEDANDDFWVDGDYHLLPDSPCIDAGTDAGVYDDIEGNVRPCDYPEVDNNADLPEFDMGAYEAMLPPIEVPMKLTPQALNPTSKGRWLKAHLVLPEGFAVEDVDTDTPALLEPLSIESEYMNVFINEDGLVEIETAFSRSDFCGSLTSNEPVEVNVTGLLTTGQQFYGTDTLRITNNYLEYLAVLSSYWLRTDCSKPHWCDGADLNADSVVNFVDFALLDGCCIEVIKH
ncbi:MAG: right-handed parallel beta-helix repeat-containing protein [Planctomycetota bacterium]|jgi:hypothetical protein